MHSSPQVLTIVILAAQTVTCAEEPKSAPKPSTVQENVLVVGPVTESRFPSLRVPEGFRATLFACDPLIEYPSAIAIGPRLGSLFVAHDYVTGLGIKIVRRDEIRLIRDTDKDGYADTSILFAKGFNSIQGLAYSDGTVYVMHAPVLTALRDTDGNGVADERRDLINGLGLPPEENDNRLHCANGVVAGHDGWLYLALGDRGCDVLRPEGDHLLFQEGGILRCRFDGTDLHVFASGLRNIYDIALDEELNVFVRDNENDGGDYMIRVCHTFFGADHGYPYLYRERPEEAVTPLADLGRGSSAGGVSYLETAFPPPYRESLFFCEWGRSVVRYNRVRAGSGFTPMQEIDFAVGAAEDPYGFKPTDIIVDWDGSLVVSDWADGQRPKRGRGRIYRIQYDDPKKPAWKQADLENLDLDQLVVRLDSSSYYTRVAVQTVLEKRGSKGTAAVKQAIEGRRLGVVGRLHAVWILTRQNGTIAIDDLFGIIESDTDPRVRAQALRALSDLVDPVLKDHRLDRARGDSKIAGRIAKVSSDQDPRVVLEAVIGLGRLGWKNAPDWIASHGDRADPVFVHAAMQTLRRADDWSAVLNLLDRPNRDDKLINIRSIALQAIADRANETVTDELINRLLRDPNAARRREYADALARIYKKPGPWTYWGFRPGPRPVNTVPWSRTEPIENALNRALSDSDYEVRRFVLKRLLREQVSLQIERLTTWIAEDKDANRVSELINAFKDQPTSAILSVMESIVKDTSRPEVNRRSALDLLVERLVHSDDMRLLDIAQSIEDCSLLARVIQVIGKRPKIPCDEFLLQKIGSPSAEVRAATIEALADRAYQAAAIPIMESLADKDHLVLGAAAGAVGTLKIVQAEERLLALAGHSDPSVRRASLVSLRQLGSPRGVLQAVAALDHSRAQIAALGYLEDFGGPNHLDAVARLASSSRSMETLSAVVRVISHWESKSSSDPHRSKMALALARVHGESGTLFQWRVFAQNTSKKTEEIVRQVNDVHSAYDTGTWKSQLATGTDGQVNLPAVESVADSTWLTAADVLMDEKTNVEFLASSNGTCHVWVNGDLMFHRDEPKSYRVNSERFEGRLRKGLNRILVKVTGTKDGAKFHLNFRPKNSQADHERLTQLALRSRGNVERGGEIFRSAEKSQCIHCHRIDDQGARIAPDLTGIGRRFSRVHLIESILNPSRTIAPSYETNVIVLQNGRVVSGVKVAETESTLTIADNQGKSFALRKNEIEETHIQSQSTMPAGLEKRLDDQEFLNLIEFLVQQR